MLFIFQLSYFLRYISVSSFIENIIDKYNIILFPSTLETGLNLCHWTLYLLMTTIVVFNLFYHLITMIKLQLLGMNYVFKNPDLRMFGLKLEKYEQFAPT